MTAVILTDVTLAGDKRPRLDNVSLTISARDVGGEASTFRTAIVGYSGAGKTSLLNIISQFEEPSSGTVTRRGNADLGPSKRLPLYWVPQNGGLWNHLTIEQHIAIVGCEPTIGEQLLKELDIHDRRTAFPSELSQGERSRVALARALCSNAELLVMDEPLSHVDPVRKPGYWNVIDGWLKRENTSLIFSSHEPEIVLRWSDRVICLHEGQVIYDGDTRSLYDKPPTEQAGQFLGPLNWFSQEECFTILDFASASLHGLPVRPEQLELTPVSGDESSSTSCLLEVVSTQFCGSSTQSLVRNPRSGKIRTLVHQSKVAIPLGSLVKVQLFRHDSFG